MSDIHSLDLALFAIVVASAIFAYLRGFVRELFALVTWFGAAAAAWYAFEPASAWLEAHIEPPLLARAAAGAGGFLIALVLLSFLTTRLAARVGRSELNALDRSLGFLFGLVRGAFIVSALYAVASLVVPPERQPAWVQSARSLPMVAAGARHLERLLPGRIAHYGASEAERARREVERVEQGRRLYELLQQPRPEAEPEAAAQPPLKGYKDRDRRELDRLIEGAR